MISILLITHEYPIKRGDASFIESEMPYLAKAFDTVHVLCLGRCGVGDALLTVPKNVHVSFMDWKYSGIKKCVSLLAVAFSLVFYKELGFLIKEKRLSIGTLRSIIGFLLRAIILQKPIKRIVQSNKNICLIYTYWYVQETLGALLLKKRLGNIVCITRAHGYDVHEFQNRANYLPYKIWMDGKIDRIFFACHYLRDYYLCKFARHDMNKYTTMHLGIQNKVFEKNTDNNKNLGIFIICSCSYVILRKRVDLIIKSLGEIEDARIHWIHIGDGSLEKDIKSLADDILGDKPNISYEFKGYMTSEQIMRFYNKNNIDCFISTTEAEGGCPVSISEAISFGIPVIATAVGGVPEIVKENFGVLLDSSGDISEISNAIVGLCKLPMERMMAMRLSARSFWENNFNAEINHAKFAEELLALVVGSS